MNRFTIAPLAALSTLLVGSVLCCGPSARAQKPPAKSGGQSAAASKVLSNAKQIGEACLKKAAASGNALRIWPTSFKKDVSAYVKDPNVFTSPLDKPGTQSFQYNVALRYAQVKNIKRPANTVMAYEGQWGKPLFRYDGNAIIVFADGHAKFVSPEQAKGLSWKP